MSWSVDSDMTTYFTLILLPDLAWEKSYIYIYQKLLPFFQINYHHGWFISKRIFLYPIIKVLMLIKIWFKVKKTQIDHIIELAWSDEVTFNDIKIQYGIDEKDVIKIMRENLKRRSFKLWRKRVSGRKSKHWKIKNSQWNIFKK